MLLSSLKRLSNFSRKNFSTSSTQANSGMEYRHLGPTGLKVSLLSYGNWITTASDQDQSLSNEAIARCIDLGINYFDTAEIYANGKAEEIMGNSLKTLKVPRHKLVLSTKVFWRGQDTDDPNARGLSRKKIIESLNLSLSRMQLDYVDIVFAHRYDLETPIEEVCRAFDWVINSGKAFYWGTSEWTADQVMEAYAVCEKYNLHKPIAEQSQYNMLHRQRFEVDYSLLFERYKMGSTVWSPLAGGILTGKYVGGVGKGTRVDKAPERVKKFKELHSEENKERGEKMFKELGEIAKQLDCSLAQLALAWVLKNKDVSTAIFGVSKVQQIDDNVKAVSIYRKITPELEEKIEQILGNSPDPAINFRTWKPVPSRRLK